MHGGACSIVRSFVKFERQTACIVELINKCLRHGGYIRRKTIEQITWIRQ